MSFFEKHRGLFLLNISSLFIFFSCAIIRTVTLSPFDNAWLAETAHYTHTTLTDLMLALSTVLSPSVLGAACALLVAVLLYQKRFRWAFFFLISLVCTMLSVYFLKNIFAVARPTTELIVQSGYSFPSGHAAVASAFFFALLYAAEKTIHDTAVLVLWFLASIGFVIAVSISRTYLEVHVMSDVVAGVALGAFWVSICILWYNRREFVLPN